MQEVASVVKLGRGAELGVAHRMLLRWFDSARDDIDAEQVRACV
jgi:hypothetical protein